MSKKLLTSQPERSYNIYVKNEWSPILEVHYVS